MPWPLAARTYENQGLTLWRTLQLAQRLTAALPNVEVLPVLSDATAALQHISSYLKARQVVLGGQA